LSKNIYLKFSGILLKSGVDLPSEIQTTKMLVSRNAREDNNSGLYNLTLTRKNESSHLDVYLYFNRFMNKFRNIVKNAPDTTVNDDKEHNFGTGFSYKKILNNGILTAKFSLSGYSIKGNFSPDIENKRKSSSFLNYMYFFKEKFIINPYFSIFNDSIRGRVAACGINLNSLLSENIRTYLKILGFKDFPPNDIKIDIGMYQTISPNS